MTLAELGSILREKREAMGFSVDDISERIKVSMRIIKLIEEGNVSGLPHSVYTRGFIISYAEVLHMDKDELLIALDAIFPSEDIEEISPMTQVVSPIHHRGARTKQFLVCLGLLIIVAVIVAGGWFVVKNFGSDIADLVKKPFAASSETPQQSAPVEYMTGSAGVQEQATIQASTRDSASPYSGGTPIQGNANESVGEIPVTLPQSPAQENAAEHVPGQMAGQVSGQTTGQVAGQVSGQAVTQQAEETVVVISPKAPCWTRITADNKPLLEKTLIPGSDFTFQYKNNATIVLGNPSGINLTIDGKPYTGNLRSSQALTITLPQ